jgi:NADPH:quinone reductase-like Zn-dependent oxidoreductase
MHTPAKAGRPPAGLLGVGQVAGVSQCVGHPLRRDRVHDEAGVTAAIDRYGTETAQAARELGVPDERITTIAAQVDGITPANGANAAPGAIAEIARLVAAGQLRVPIAASFPVEQIRAAVELQAGRHVHGKLVIDL